MCGYRLFDAPLLRYRNLPRFAQFLPALEDLPQDLGVDMDIRQCAGCGLVQLDVDAVPYHREVIRAVAVSPEMGAFRASQFSDIVNRFSLTGKKVVEIGCGRGEYLSILQRSGVQAYGLEYSPDAVADATRNGLRVTRGYAGDPDCLIEQAPFDAFFILSFLEHLPDLPLVLDGIRRHLAPGGVGVVEVPNFDMIVAKHLFSEFVTDHLFYFTADTLTTTLKSNGFDVVDCTAVWHDYIISAIVRLRGPLDLTAFETQQRVVHEQIDRFLSRFGPKQVAIWGAGHQALAVMALSSLGERVRYIVDSAAFKQGRYSPATHIPIVAPDTLLSDPVDAVIVMAGSYSNEVAASIRRRYAPRTEIAILADSGLQLAASPDP